jgi:transposase
MIRHMETPDLAGMDVEELRKLASSLITAIEQKDVERERIEKEIQWKDLKISQLTHEMAVLKRWRFGRGAEEFTGLQRSLLEESIDEDLGAIEIELTQLQGLPKPRTIPVRSHLPLELPRVEIRHEPQSTVCECGCQMKRIAEDVSEKLDYVPGTFQVERHVRGKWVCEPCERILQAPVAPHVIDKGIPTAGLLAQVLVAKYADHLPLYRQEEIYGRSGVPISRSTMADWVGACGVKLQPLRDALKELLLRRAVLHADETPMPTLRPGLKKTHRSYLWAYGTTGYDPDPIVIYDFAVGRSGEHARLFLGEWRGQLVCDDFSGYKALFQRERPCVEVGCMAHARRKFYELHAKHQSQIAGEALEYYGRLYDVERRCHDLHLDAQDRAALRQSESVPVAEQLHGWLTKRLADVAPGSATHKAIRYSLGRWMALTRYLADADLPIDNNWLENRIRPIALGRNNWLFAGSDRAGRRAAVIMSLIQSAKLNGHDPYRYLKDVLERLPTQSGSRLEELLPHRWQASTH